MQYFEGTIQDNPFAIPIYALLVILLMLIVLEKTNTKRISDSKMAAIADDFSAADWILSLRYWWDTSCKLGPNFGYFPEPTKSWLTAKSDCFDKAVHIFNDSNIQITTQGRRHLGAALCMSQFTDQYIMEKRIKWVE